MLTLPPTYFTSTAGPENIPIIRFKGQATDVAPVLRDYRAGKTFEELCAWYDSADPAAIRAAIDYYHQHQEEVNCYLDEIQAYVEHVRQATPIALAQQRVEQYKREHKLG